MTYNQRDLVYVTVETPSSALERHPFLILSCRTANSYENYYTGVMMTSSDQRDRFSMPVYDEMFEGNLRKEKCKLRLYLIVSFQERKIEELVTRMKREHFIKVLEEIKQYVLVAD